MKYCKRCVLPDTKPGVKFDAEGICSACRAVERKKTIDWAARDRKLRELCDAIRGKNGNGYDCIVPVSGGKDSMYQVYAMSQIYNMKVLAVNALCHVQTTEGILNLNAMIENLGVDLIKIGVKPSVLQSIRRMAMLKIGNPNYAEHRVMFSAVARAAVFYNVPLVVWGEDIGVEFGGNVSSSSADEGSAEDLIDNDLFRENSFDNLLEGKVSPSEMFFYLHPPKELLRRKGVKSIYLGFFHWWDGYKHYKIAEKYGFQGRQAGNLSGNVINYDNIDEKLCEIHLWFKFLKLGFWRATDECCYHIWNGRMTREEAVEKVNAVQYQFPYEYLPEFLDYHQITEKDLFDCCEKFRNHDIWEKQNGEWRLKVPLV